MTLADFQSRHSLRLSPSVTDVAHAGLDLMAKSVDPLHTLDHIYRMFDDLDLMVTHLHDISWRKINFDILLLAVIWHDTYKSRHFARSKRRMFFDHILADGLGSMRLFTRSAKKFGLDTYTTKKVRYAIRKHSVLQLLPRRTQEAKILKYLDELEDWSFARFDHVLANVHNFSDFAPRMLPIFRFYFEHWMLRKNGNAKQPAWVKSEYLSRKHRFITDMAEKVKASFSLLRTPSSA